MLSALSNDMEGRRRNADALWGEGRWAEAADAFQKLADIWYRAIVEARSEEARTKCMAQFKECKSYAEDGRLRASGSAGAAPHAHSSGGASASRPDSSASSGHASTNPPSSNADGGKPGSLRSQLFRDDVGKMLIAQVDGMRRNSGVSWDDIGGMDELIRDLKTILAQSVMRRPDGSAPEGAGKILLLGPAGTGKTLLVAAVAHSLSLGDAGTFFEATPAALEGHYKGNTAKSISLLYETARESAPSVVFLDEIDGLVSDESVRGALLPELDGMKSKGDGTTEPPFVLTIGATNHPERLDSALLSRFGSHIVLVGGADARGRRDILHKLLRKYEIESPDLLSWLAADERTDRFSGRDLQNLVKNAALKMQKDMNPEAGTWKDISEVMGKTQKERPLNKDDFLYAITYVKGSIDPVEVARLEAWLENPKHS